MSISGKMGPNSELPDSWYKLSLGCNISQFLLIFFGKLILNSYNANKNLEKLYLWTKFSNFQMTFVSFKKLLRFIQNKWGKHFMIGKRGLSRIEELMLHNGNYVSISREIWLTNSLVLCSGTRRRGASCVVRGGDEFLDLMSTGLSRIKSVLRVPEDRCRNMVEDSFCWDFRQQF